MLLIDEVYSENGSSFYGTALPERETHFGERSLGQAKILTMKFQQNMERSFSYPCSNLYMPLKEALFTNILSPYIKVLKY